MYAKIFAQIYDGTLATTGNWHALVTFQQMLILADQEGTVDMTIASIVRRTTIPREIIESGIQELLKPDPESRTPDEDGRRLIPLSESRSWGWRIVNYTKYRQINREADRREYHKEYYHTKRKRKSVVEGVEKVEIQHAQQIPPIAEAKAKAEAKASTPDGVEDISSDTFEKFWVAYPKKQGKGNAQKAWAKVKAPAATLGLVLEALQWQKKSQQWLAEGGQYIPMPATYINGKRWLDEKPSDTVTQLQASGFRPSRQQVHFNRQEALEASNRRVAEEFLKEMGFNHD